MAKMSMVPPINFVFDATLTIRPSPLDFTSLALFPSRPWLAYPSGGVHTLPRDVCAERTAKPVTETAVQP